MKIVEQREQLLQVLLEPQFDVLHAELSQLEKLVPEVLQDDEPQLDESLQLDAPLLVLQSEEVLHPEPPLPQLLSGCSDVAENSNVKHKNDRMNCFI